MCQKKKINITILIIYTTPFVQLSPTLQKSETNDNIRKIQYYFHQ